MPSAGPVSGAPLRSSSPPERRPGATPPQRLRDCRTGPGPLARVESKGGGTGGYAPDSSPGPGREDCRSMREYQYYEFLAIDRPLSKREMAELRAISTRAEITPTSFVNTYEWGDLKARPIELMKKYFDAFVYLANWGTRECLFRLPLEKVDLDALTPYLKGDAATLTKTPSFAIFSFGTDGEGAEDDAALETGEGMMASLLPLRGVGIR